MDYLIAVSVDGLDEQTVFGLARAILCVVDGYTRRYDVEVGCEVKRREIKGCKWQETEVLRYAT